MFVGDDMFHGRGKVMKLVKTCEKYPTFLEDVLASLNQAVLLADINGDIFYSTQIAEQLFGYTASRFSGAKLSIIFTDEDLTYLYPNLLYLARKQQPFEGEVMLKRKNGTKFFAFLSFRPCLDEEKESAIIIACVQDIEKQKQFEKAMRETHFEDMVKIANGIAHELRNPLVGIGGFVKRLHGTCSAEGNHEHEKYYEYIFNNLKRIENLVKKIDYLVTLPKPVFKDEPITSMVENAVDPFREEIQNRNISFLSDVEDRNLLVDGTLIARTISILIENSLEAIKDGGSIKIASRADDSYYEIHVKDNGHGISKEDLPYIFNPFFSTNPTGAGIDLAVVKRIMESHNGTVEAKSQPGEETAFILRFPFERRRPIRIELLDQQ